MKLYEFWELLSDSLNLVVRDLETGECEIYNGKDGIDESFNGAEVVCAYGTNQPNELCIDVYREEK